MITLRAGSATDVGLVRSNNQDQFLVAHPLYAVADGMGGAAAGEVASAIAVETLRDAFATEGTPSPERLVEAARAANRAVWNKAEANPEMRGMGTTLVALALVPDDAPGAGADTATADTATADTPTLDADTTAADTTAADTTAADTTVADVPTAATASDPAAVRLAIANIGDSRLYGFRNGELRQITSDHNLVAEMVAEGRITKEEAEVHPRRNIMTRALGVEPDVPVDLFLEPAVPGDRYLLCSDGLPREVRDELISSMLRRLTDPQEAATELVEEAKRRGGNDNITVVVVDVVDSETAPADATTALPLAAGAPFTSADPTRTGVLPAITAEQTAEEAAPARVRVRPRPTNLVTPRVIAFIVLFLIIVGAGAAGVVWYARSSYYVGLQGGRLVVFQGRPGGVLGMNPTVRERTTYTISDVQPQYVSDVEGGHETASYAAAKTYVAQILQPGIPGASTATTTTTAASTTTAPTTTTLPVVSTLPVATTAVTTPATTVPPAP